MGPTADKATGGPWSCLRGHDGTGWPHGMSSWTRPRGEFRCGRGRDGCKEKHGPPLRMRDGRGHVVADKARRGGEAEVVEHITFVEVAAQTTATDVVAAEAVRGGRWGPLLPMRPWDDGGGCCLCK